VVVDFALQYDVVGCWVAGMRNFDDARATNNQEDMMPIDDVNRLLAQIDRELWLVTAADGQQRSGLIATFVGTASIVPELPRMLVGIGRRHFTHELIEQSGRFALHLLGEELLDWVWRFGLASGRDGDKFANLELEPDADGPPRLAAALGRLDCRVESRMETGDRTIYLAEVLDGYSREGGERPLTMQRMLGLAPADKKQDLKRQLDRDAALDAPAIRAWREAGAGYRISLK
jgi:flavin reductase (DIM6/NTAB) family NADH-FMN oxidoreductase RutF